MERGLLLFGWVVPGGPEGPRRRGCAYSMLGKQQQLPRAINRDTERPNENENKIRERSLIEGRSTHQF